MLPAGRPHLCLRSQPPHWAAKGGERQREQRGSSRAQRLRWPATCLLRARCWLQRKRSLALLSLTFAAPGWIEWRGCRTGWHVLAQRPHLPCARVSPLDLHVWVVGGCGRMRAQRYMCCRRMWCETGAVTGAAMQLRHLGRLCAKHAPARGLRWQSGRTGSEQQRQLPALRLLAQPPFPIAHREGINVSACQYIHPASSASRLPTRVSCPPSSCALLLAHGMPTTMLPGLSL